MLVLLNQKYQLAKANKYTSKNSAKKAHQKKTKVLQI